MIAYSRLQWPLVLFAGLILAVAYAAHAPISGEHTRIEDVISGTAYYPWNARLLLPLALGWLGPEVTHSLLFRAIICLISFAASVTMLPAFARRLDVEATPLMLPCFLLVCVAHYCLPVVYSPFYVFDFPAIPFYLIAFLLLTDERKWVMLTGMLATLVFFWNRESVLAAPLQAIVWWERSTPFKEPPTRGGSVAAITVVLVFTVRFILGGESNIAAQLFENGNIRLLANLHRAFTEWGSFLQLILIGFGAVFYLPFVVRSQSAKMKAYLVGSVIPMGILLLLGNITEIRTFAEFLPAFAVLLACRVPACQRAAQDPGKDREVL